MTDIFKSRRDLVQTVLEELQVVAYGQSPAPSEYTAVDEHVDLVVAECAAREICYIADIDQIPIEQLNALAQVIARNVANKFSISPQEVAQMYPDEKDPVSPENRLRAINRVRAANVPLTPDYF